MQAKETKLQDIIEGTKQYVIPLFQRAYSWTNKEWEVLWKDIVELCENEQPRTHFIGSLVNLPTVAVPEGVAKYLLIDGQQRLTTVFLLLAIVRDIAKEAGNTRFADEIDNTLLVNQYKDGNDHFKLMPTQLDREAFKAIILRNRPEKLTDQISKSYEYFEKKIKNADIDPERIKKVITSHFSLVSIVLDPNDNPYLVFESLNAKGRPLTQSDLIRNFFFMRIHESRHEEVNNKYWQPMQIALGDNLTEFIRHFLIRGGKNIKQNEVYYALKDEVSPSNAIEYLNKLKIFSTYYQRLLFPEHEPNLNIQKYLLRLNRIEITTVYPFLLNIYESYDIKKIDDRIFTEILKTLENYLIRRSVCNLPTNHMNKVFPVMFGQIESTHPNNFEQGIKSFLQARGYPRDAEFLPKFKEATFYGSGDRVSRTKLILETIEETYEHKEPVSFEKLTVEHIMPQTLNQTWQKSLGTNWGDIHESYLHTIGNLTLTAYNTELSNDSFAIKKKIYQDSHLEINKYFSSCIEWTASSIEQRAGILAQQALKIWPFFGDNNQSSSVIKSVTGTTPVFLHFLGQKIAVESWRDVLENTLNLIAEEEPTKFEILVREFTKTINKSKVKLKSVRQLKNGYFIETNQSARGVERFCSQALESVDIGSDSWQVITK